MEQQQSMFKKKELVVAVGVALLSGVMSGCGSSNSTATAGDSIYTMDVSGGNGGDVGGDGGEAGSIYLYNNGGTGGVQIRATGKADASFSSPVPAVTANTGANPLDVTADTTILTPSYTYDTPVADLAAVSPGSIYIGTDGILYDDDGDGYAQYATDAVVDDERYYTDGSELYQAIDDLDTEIANLVDAGTPYRLNGDEIYLADGTAATADARVTGISVAAGATLTVENHGSSGSITVEADIANDGTITMEDRGDGNDLNLTSDRYIASGTIDNSGVAQGDNGGSVYLYAVNGIHNSGSILAHGADALGTEGGDGAEIYLTTQSYLKNSGMLDAHGANADVGEEGYGSGYGGYVNLEGAYVENSGAIDASGGNLSASGYGGAFGGQVNLLSLFDLNNSGDINIGAGDGGYGSGERNVGYVRMMAGCLGSSCGDGDPIGVGSVRNSGNIDASGGDELDDNDGGYAGSIHIYAYGGDVINTGDMDVSGGATIATSGTLYGESGYGGDISIRAKTGYGGAPAGDIMFSGNLTARGGDAAAGDATQDSYMDAGYGGSIDMRNELNDSATDQVIALYGYNAINLNGGNGAQPRAGGSLEVGNSTSWNAANGNNQSGSVVNEVAINARGGDVSAAVDRTNDTSYSYGFGGYVEMYTSNSEGIASNMTVTNSGDIDVSGGNVVNEESDWHAGGGDVYLFGQNGVQNSGDIDASGGLDDGTMEGYGEGGYGGDVEIGAYTGAVANSGVVNVSGGDGAYQGGNAGGAYLMGYTVNNGANISANGGNASTAEGVTESYGGDGGYISLFGVSALNAAINSATLSYSAGTGVTPGTEGSSHIGLVCEGNCSGM